MLYPVELRGRAKTLYHFLICSGFAAQNGHLLRSQFIPEDH